MIRRLASQADWPRIVEIYNATISARMATADTEPVTVEARSHWFREHTPDFRPLWVIEDCNNVVAWLSFSSFYGRPAYNRTAELSIYVDEAYRRQRIAHELLRDAISHAPTLSVDTLLGFIFAHNTASLALFRKFDFEQWAHLPRVARLDGVDKDLVILGLSLS
jgi:L-amino acid N-acyltransferase YncA